MKQIKMLITAVMVCGLAMAVSATVEEGVGNVFVAGRDVVLRGVAAAGSECLLTDWLGERLRGIKLDGAGNANLGRMEVGYYLLSVGTNRISSLAVVPDPERRVRTNNSFYAVDSAQSWISHPKDFLCAWNGGDTFKTVSDLLWLAGVGNVRDRLSATDVNDSQGRMAYGRYLYNAELLRERGIKISGMFHDTPPHVDQARDRIHALPKDLVWLYGFTRRVAEDFGDRMCDWEFWNEEDGGFSTDAVWDFGAAMKAAALGFRAGNPKAVVLPGGVFNGTRNAYDRGLYDNDIAKYCDAFNFHAYGTPKEMAGLVSGIRSFLGEYHLGDRAIWVTECGSNNEGPAEAVGFWPKFKAHSPRQELLQAETYVKMQVALQMAGVVRSHYFAFGAYSERGGKKDWGVIRRDGTVKPIFSAISTTMEELATARLEGAVEVDPFVEAYQFARTDGKKTLVFWTKSSKEEVRKFNLRVSGEGCELRDMCGRRLHVRPSNGVLELNATRYPVYLSDSGTRQVVRAAAPCGVTGAAAAAADEDLSLILRVELDKDDFRVTERKSVADLQHEVGRLRIVVWNLGNRVREGRILAKGGRLDDVPDKIVVPPMGQSSFPCRLVPESGAGRSQLVLQGVFDGKRTTRLAMPYRSPMSCETIPFDWSCLTNWTINATSAVRKELVWDDAEKALCFTYEWTDPKIDRYFYPSFALKLPPEEQRRLKMIGFEVKSEQDKVENDYRLNYVFVAHEKGTPTDMLEYLAPQQQWETRFVDFGKSVEKQPVRALAIGGNPFGMKCRFWLKDVKLFK